MSTPVLSWTDTWEIEGYRQELYHSVYRHTGHAIDGSGMEVYELGRKLFDLAGLRFDDS